MNLDRQRILLVAESLTLAQVVRLVALARALDVTRYEVHFASSEFDPIAFHGTDFRRWPLHSIDKREAMRKLEAGTAAVRARCTAWLRARGARAHRARSTGSGGR